MEKSDLLYIIDLDLQASMIEIIYYFLGLTINSRIYVVESEDR